VRWATRHTQRPSASASRARSQSCPLIAEALEQGELAHSAVRELSRVAVPGTEEAWLEAARGKSLREIEALVSGHRPGHLPSDETEPRLHRRTITLEVSPETYDIWRKMHALAAEEHGQRLSDDELIPAMFRRAYGSTCGGSGRGGSGGRGDSTPAYKIALKQCPDCKRAWQYSGGRDIEVDPAVAECAACDAVHLGSLDAAAPERATMTVTARKREQVLARDGHGCTVPGCRRNVGLDLHHIVYQSRGGSHELKNLTTICDLHHRAVHYGKLVIRGTAPDRLTFEFHKPRDRRNITDDETPTPRSPHVIASPHAGSQHAGSQHADSQHADSQHADSQHAGSQHADSQHADSQHADSQHADSQHALLAQPHGAHSLAFNLGPSGPTGDPQPRVHDSTDCSTCQSDDDETLSPSPHASSPHASGPRSVNPAALPAQAHDVPSLAPDLEPSGPTGDPQPPAHDHAGHGL
jgi:hypothetical protein